VAARTRPKNVEFSADLDRRSTFFLLWEKNVERLADYGRISTFFCIRRPQPDPPSLNAS
jgi:hypothetical protein